MKEVPAEYKAQTVCPTNFGSPGAGNKCLDGGCLEFRLQAVWAARFNLTGKTRGYGR